MPFRPIRFLDSLPYKRFVSSRRPKLLHHRPGIDQPSLVFSQVFPVTAPLPLPRLLHHFGSHRIEMDVAHQLQQVAIAVAHDRLVAPLKQMPAVTVCSVKSPRVSGQQRLHHPRRRSLLHFQEQMEMVRHQNVGVEVKRITLSRRGQPVEKRFEVAVLKKYLPAVVSAGHHMIEQSLRVDSGMSGHDAPLSKLVDLGKSDTGMTPTGLTPEWN